MLIKINLFFCTKYGIIYFMIKLKVTKQNNLSKFLCAETGLSFSLINKKIREKQVLVNNLRVSDNVLLQEGDIVVLFASSKTYEFKKIYEDENILVIIKPKGIEAVSKNEASVEKELSKTYKFIRACHRLDRNTEGLLLLAKNASAEEELLKGFKSHKINKTYFAFCFGHPPKNKIKAVAHLTKNSKASTVMIFKEPVKDSEPIITEFNLLQQNGEIAKLEVSLITGKTHQIRAHLAFLGYPVVGDGKYGNSELNKKYNKKTQELYAVKLEFHLSGMLSYLNEQTFEYSPTVDIKGKKC